MKFIWGLITFSSFSPEIWLKASFYYRIVGLFRNWRQSSFLLRWGKTIGALLISLILMFSPFVTTGVIGIWLISIAMYWIILIVSEREQPVFNSIHLLVFLYWVISAIAVIFSPVRDAAFSGFIKLTLYLIFFACTSHILRSPILTNWLILSTLGSGLLVCIYGVRQRLFGVEQLATWNDPTAYFSNSIRVYSYLGNPNLLSAYILPSIALSMAAFFVWQKTLPKLLALTILLINTFCLYFTGSRSGWIALIICLVIFSLLLFTWFKDELPLFWRQWLLHITFGTLISFIFVLIASNDILQSRIMSIFIGRADSSNNFRINVWTSVVNMIKDYPFLGIGPGNDAFSKIYPLYMSPKYSALSAYSVFLETAVEMGLVGLSIFIWLIFTIINQGIQKINKLKNDKNSHGIWIIAAVAAIVGLLMQGLFDTVWYRPQVNTLWWFLVALIASQHKSKEKINIHS